MELVALSEFLDRHIIVYSEEKGSVKVREFNQTKASDGKSVSPHFIVTLSIVHTHTLFCYYLFLIIHIYMFISAYTGTCRNVFSHDYWLDKFFFQKINV